MTYVLIRLMNDLLIHLVKPLQIIYSITLFRIATVTYLFSPGDDLESRPKVTTISNDTNDNDMNHFEASNTINEIRIKNLNNIISGHLNVDIP